MKRRQIWQPSRQQLYLRDINSFVLLYNRCRQCNHANIHGFYHQIKSAGKITIYRERLRASFRWQCDKCGTQATRVLRLTTSTRRPRVKLFRWMQWSKWAMDAGTYFPSCWPIARRVGLWLLRMEDYLPF